VQELKIIPDTAIKKNKSHNPFEKSCDFLNA
jgi:hypothetical protein